MIGPLYALMLRQQVTRVRLLALLALGIIGVVVGAAIGAAGTFDPTAAGTRFLDAFGLSLFVPVTVLVFASAAFGDPTEDETLVYLWLRPVPRWQLVIAAFLSSVTISWPLVVGPLAFAAAATGGGADLVVGVVVASTVSVVGYAAVFVALGLRVRRALVWGLLYIFIWEGFVATANLSAARLALRSYSRSLLADHTGVSLPLADFTTTAAVAVPIGVAVVGLVYASWRLAHQDVA
jgi:ABC-2 type transport system permease protein